MASTHFHRILTVCRDIVHWNCMCIIVKFNWISTTRSDTWRQRERLEQLKMLQLLWPMSRNGVHTHTQRDDTPWLLWSASECTVPYVISTAIRNLCARHVSHSSYHNCIIIFRFVGTAFQFTSVFLFGKMVVQMDCIQMNGETFHLCWWELRDNDNKKSLFFSFDWMNRISVL